MDNEIKLKWIKNSIIFCMLILVIGSIFLLGVEFPTVFSRTEGLLDGSIIIAFFILLFSSIFSFAISIYIFRKKKQTVEENENREENRP